MNNNLKSFKDLTVWQKSADLAVSVYKITEKFPRSELYGITNQMRRAVISISSNLAEGFKRSHNKEKLQFYNIAYGSTSELESQIEISKKLGFLSENDYQGLIAITVEISKMNNGLIKSLNSKSYILNSNRGQLLIESGVAISILVVGLLGIFGLLSHSLSLNNVVSSQYIASNLASEGIEVVKNLIDGNIVQFKPWNEGINTGSYEVAFDSLILNPNQDRFLLFDATGNIYNYQIGQETPYKRTIQITNIGPDEIKVNSVVNWQIRGGSYSVNLEDHFFNWRQ